MNVHRKFILLIGKPGNFVRPEGIIMESVVRTSSRIDVTRQRAKQDEGVRIAVVEDDRMYRHAIEVYLRKVPDSRVVSFDSGEQCFRHYHNVNPDILILDYSLSGDHEGGRMNGLDVLRKVKSIRPKTKVIFLAGQGNIDVATAAMKGGAIDFITKDKNGLIRLVNQVQRLSLAIQLKREETRTSKWIALGVTSIAVIVLATLSADSGDAQGMWGWLWAALLTGVAVFLIRGWVKQSGDNTRQTRTSRRNQAGRWLD
jgi:FixJ family two-component response regulator